MNYTVTHTGEPFRYTGEWPQFVQRNDTVIVTFYNEDGSIFETKEYGYINTRDLYFDIIQGKAINLNKTYINNFSFTECCNEMNSHQKKDFVGLSQFSAEDSFWEGATSFDFAPFGSNGVISFEGAKFDGCASFRFIEFGNNNVNFDNTEFLNGDVTFSHSNFELGLSFVDAKFLHGDVNFMGTRFGDGDVSFGQTIFENGNVLFDASDFSNTNLYFFKAIIKQGNVSFFSTKFGEKEVSLFRAQADKVRFIGCKFNGNVDMRLSECNRLDLIDCTIFNTFNMKNSIDEPTIINELYLTDTNNLGQLYLDWNSNNVLAIINNQTDTNWIQKAEQLILLKENFKSLGQYDDEDKAFVEYKRCQRKALHNNEYDSKGKKRFKELFDCFFSWAVDKVGEYGTKPRKVAFNMGIIIILFALILYIFPTLLNQNYIIVDKNIVLNGFWPALQHSLVTFLTIGYGNTYPAHWLGVILCGLEGFSGVFLMAYFVVAIVRKTLR